MPVLFTFPVDPAVLALFVSCEDKGLAALIDGVEPETDDPGPDTRYETAMAKIKPLLQQLPEREADMWIMYYLHRKRQLDIADIFEVTQAAVSYTLSRTTARLKFLMSVPRLQDAEVERLLVLAGLKDIPIKILMSYRETSQQTLTAQNLKLTQGRVRHQIRKSCELLERRAAEDEAFRDVARLFCALRDNPNILRRVVLPQWAGRGNKLVDDRFA